MAALSGLLFEARRDGPVESTADLRIDWCEAPKVLPARLRVETDATGCSFHLLDDARGPVLGEVGATLRVQRWDGPGEGTSAYTREATLPGDGRGAWWYRDTLDEPTAWDGRPLRWQFTLVDVHGEPRLRAGWRTVWERSDRPPPIADATARYDADAGMYGRGAVRAILTLPDLTNEVRERLEVRMYGRGTSITVCGYYGGADDDALLEAQRALDFHHRAVGAGADHPATRFIAGGRSFAHDGLVLLGTAAVGAGDTVELDVSDSVSAELDRAPEVGLQLYAVLARRRLVSTEAPTSVGVRCRLVLRYQGADAPVVQFERVLPPPAGRVWCTTDRRATVLEPETAPATVNLGWRHAPRWIVGGAAFATGGYRVWVRDLLADDDGEPFRHVGDVQVMPPLLASLRPLPPLAGDWTIAATDTEIPGADLSTADALALVDRVFGPSAPSDAAWLAGARAALDAPALAALAEGPSAVDFVRILLTAGLGVVLKASLATLDMLSTPSEERFRASWSVRTQLGEPGVLASFGIVEFEDAQRRPYGWCVILVRPDAGLLKALGAPVTAVVDRLWAPHLRLREPRPPIQTLVPDADQQVRFPWTGLVDRWAHRLEWAVEALDRYALLRRDFAEAVPPTAADPGFTPVATYVPRTEPLVATDQFGVLAEPVPNRAWASFRLTDPAAWQEQAHNTTMRTRLGQLSMELATRRSLPYALRAGPRLGEWLRPDFVERWQAAFAVSGEASAGTNRWGPVRVPLYPAVEPDTEPLPPAVRRVDLPDEPWYFRIALLVRLHADDLAGDPQTAEQDMLPQMLGLPARPEVKVTRENADYIVTIRVLTAVLGGHLSEAAATGLGGWGDAVATDPVPRVSDYDDATDVPVHLLPDLALDYHFRLVTPAGRVDLVRLTGALAEGTGVADDLTPVPRAYHPWTSAEVEGDAPTCVTLTVRCRDVPEMEMPPTVRTVLDAMVTGEVGMDVRVGRDGRLGPPLFLRVAV